MPGGFPLQDTGPGMGELFHDLAVEQEKEKKDDYDKRLALLMATTPSLSAEGWRELDTAPHDGTEVQLRIVHFLAPAYANDPGYGGYLAFLRAHWTDFNGGGFTWHGLCGSPLLQMTWIAAASILLLLVLLPHRRPCRIKVNDLSRWEQYGGTLKRPDPPSPIGKN